MRIVPFIRRSFAAAVTMILTLSVYWSYKSTTIRHKRPVAIEHKSSLNNLEGGSYAHRHFGLENIRKNQLPTPEFKKDNKLFKTSTEMSYTTPSTKNLSSTASKKIKIESNPKDAQDFGNVLLKPEEFCFMMLAARHIKVLKHNTKTVPCFVLPSQHDKLLQQMQAGNNTTFLVISTNPKSTNSESLFVDYKHINRYISQSVVVKSIPLDALTKSDLPLVIKLHVLVASVSPLRVYRHRQGQAIISLKEKCSLAQMEEHLERWHYKDEQIASMWERIDWLIVTTLMLTEASMLTSSSDKIIEPNIYLPLDFHFILNGTLDPAVLEVKSSSNISQIVRRDTSSIMSAISTLLPSNNHKNEGIPCIKPKLCLTKQQQLFSEVSDQEESRSGGFIKLYPTPDGHLYDPLISALQSSVYGNSEQGHHGAPSRGTFQVHHLLTALEHYKHNDTEALNTATHLDGTTGDARKSYLEGDGEEYEPAHTADLQEIATKDPECDDDPGAIPVLTNIHTHPHMELQPAFRHDTEAYQARVPFHVLNVRLWGKTSTCLSEARINSYRGTAQPANYSLGVGWNAFALHLMDTSHAKAWNLMSYKLHIYREKRDEHAPTFSGSLPHVTCTLTQDCDLRVFPDQPCGLEDAKMKWREFTKQRAELAACTSGHTPGRWTLPCGRCSVPESCHWQKAVWTPHTCQHITLSKQQVKSCLSNRKVLFVGDSTNRGIMYYLMEKMNGTLRHWEKTHSMRIYSGALNDDRTSVSFAYYPQFWLSSNKKAVFVKALYHLIARFMPLKNNTNTILVVGGVHWMLPSHVTAVEHALARLGLSGIKVVIKGLGSGFHLPVPGFVTLDLAGQRRIAQRNVMVSRAARSAGFEFIDTYNMTIARYKEFLYGNCGCHFHKVVKMATDGEVQEGSPQSSDHEVPPRYHVIGPINAMYSEMVISRMCS